MSYQYHKKGIIIVNIPVKYHGNVKLLFYYMNVLLNIWISLFIYNYICCCRCCALG